MKPAAIACVLFATANAVAVGGSAKNVKSVTLKTSDRVKQGVAHPLGFADADPSSDESLRMSHKKTLHSKHEHKTLHESADPASREIQQEVEMMVDRVKKLDNVEVTSAFAEELDGVEASLAAKSGDKNLVREISTVRADLCAQQGFESHEAMDCEDFMSKACAPRLSGEEGPVPKQYCTLFFREEVAQGKAVAAAPAPGPASAPGPGPVPMGTLFGGKAGRPLQEQGFDGPLIEHKDFDTQTEDWHKEFGPKSGHRSFLDICADHPGNEWCRLHGYFPQEEDVMEEVAKEHKTVDNEEPKVKTVYVDEQNSAAGHGAFVVALAAMALSTWREVV